MNLNFLLKALNVNKEESSKFFLLFFHSFFLGIFMSVYYTVANTVFIQNFESSYLSLGYLAAGLAGYLATAGYSYLQKFLKIDKLFAFALIWVSGVSILLRFSDSLFGIKAAAFLVFVFSMPFLSLVGLEMGGLITQLLDIKQIKKFFALINTGSTISSILGYLSIPLLLRLKLFQNNLNLIWIAVAGLIISFVLLVIMNRKFPERLGQVKQKSNATYQSFSFYLKQPLFFWIAISVLLSGTVNYFTDFSFLAGLRSQKTLISTPEGRANFLAIAYAGMKIGELIFSSLASRFFSAYGMNIAVSTISFVTSGFVILATATGFIAGEDSAMLFIFILLNKSFDTILRKAINDPAFKILYQTMPEDQRLDVQTKVGIVIQIAIMLSGLLLFLINKVYYRNGNFMMNFFLLTFCPMLLAWFFVSRKIYEQYKIRLRQLLSDKSFYKRSFLKKEDYGNELLTHHLSELSPKNLPICVLILSQIHPNSLTPYLHNLLKTNDKTVKKHLLQVINPTMNLDSDTINVLKEFQEPDLQSFAKRALINIDSNQISIEDEEFELVKVILKNKSIEPLLIQELLNSKKALIQQIAVHIAVRNYSPQLQRIVFNLLIDKDLSRTVVNELIVLGDQIVEVLETVFKEESDIDILLRVIELYAKIGSSLTKQKLILHARYPNKRIQMAVIKALKYAHYQADDIGKIIIKQRIAETVTHILWIYAATLDLRSERNTLKLVQALDLERESLFDVLFDLLSLMYDWAVIDLIKNNFVGEENIFALELIDNFIEEDIKLMIQPLFEGIPMTQQLRDLNKNFPQQRLSPNDRLRDIINRDFNRVDLWTKSRALELLCKGLDNQIPDELFACIYHPNELIWGTAARILHEKLGEKSVPYLEKSNSIPATFLRSIHKTEQETQNILAEKVKLLKRIPLFFSIPENELVKLATIFETRLLGSNTSISFFDDERAERILILISGKLVAQNADDSETVFARKDIIIRGFNVEDSVQMLVAKKGSIVLQAHRTNYFNLLIDEVELTRSILSNEL